MELKGLGVDLIEIKRFQRFNKNKPNHFLLSNFTKRELEYCFSFKDFASHLAGTFAGKEAVFKSIGKNILFSKIEIRREKNGTPTVWINAKKQTKTFLSISHIQKLALAIAVNNK